MNEWKLFSKEKPDIDRWIWLYNEKNATVNRFTIHKITSQIGNFSDFWTHWQYASVPDMPKEEKKLHRCPIYDGFRCEETMTGELNLHIHGRYYKIDYCCVCGYSPNKVEPPKEDEYTHKCSIGSLTCFEDVNGLFVRYGDDINKAKYWNVGFCFRCGYSPNNLEKPDSSSCSENPTNSEHPYDAFTPDNQKVFGYTKEDI